MEEFKMPIIQIKAYEIQDMLLHADLYCLNNLKQFNMMCKTDITKGTDIEFGYMQAKIISKNILSNTKHNLLTYS